MTGTVAEMGTGLRPVGGALPPWTMGDAPPLTALVAAGAVRVGRGTTLGPAAVVVPQGAVMPQGAVLGFRRAIGQPRCWGMTAGNTPCGWGMGWRSPIWR
ncbi:MAG: hypothetical protein HC918_12350 [Oscillatoriales cyanobacterium SM2_1_8]|nr:hypothetical protein [Oscillatoriales cyanobacterium SM2_1_8]